MQVHFLKWFVSTLVSKTKAVYIFIRENHYCLRFLKEVIKTVATSYRRVCIFLKNIKIYYKCKSSDILISISNVNMFTFQPEAFKIILDSFLE